MTNSSAGVHSCSIYTKPTRSLAKDMSVTGAKKADALISANRKLCPEEFYCKRWA